MTIIPPYEFLLSSWPQVAWILITAVTGTRSLMIYYRTQKRGLKLVGISILLLPIETLIRLLLGGPYLALILQSQGLSLAQIAIFSSSLTFMGVSFQLAFGFLLIKGITELAK